MNDNVISLRMERQYLTCPANKEEYQELYRDLQPGKHVYWIGFGDPPSLTFRADFDDIEFNRGRQHSRELIKVRLIGGTLGWIVPDDLELFAALYRKPLIKPSERHLRMLDLIERSGPLNIQQMKEEIGILVKEITPVLHRLQEAFLIYEDQYDGEWDRGWYHFEEMFPNADLERYTREEALKILLRRFAFRQAEFNSAMAQSYYKLPAKEINAAIQALTEDGTLTETEGGYMLRSDAELLKTYPAKSTVGVYAMHHNDFLVKSNAYWLKERFRHAEYETLQYLLIDGKFRGASLGKVHNGPFDLEDVILDLPADEAQARKTEIIEAVLASNYGENKCVKRYLGEEIK